MTYETISVTPLTPVIGAEVSGIDLRIPLSTAQHSELQDAVRKHLVLFFRNQNLSDEEHLALAARFGVPTVYPVTKARGLDEPLEWIIDSSDSPPKADLWHTDATFLRRPPDFGLLSMRQTPPTGGDTLWASLYGAYETLSQQLQRLARSLVWDIWVGDEFRRAVSQDYGREVYERVASSFEPCQHPVVRIHPDTDRYALFLPGDYGRRLADLRPEESTALMSIFRGTLNDPSLHCRWHWQENDFAFWDERCTNHRALGDHYPNRRCVRRCTVGASLPIGAE